MNQELRTKNQERPNIHATLVKGRAALETGWQPSAEEKRSVLRARAEKLSREALEEGAASGTLEAVEFLLGKERYAIESEFVVEIFPLDELTTLPCTPPFIAGIINVRGRIVSVVHLKNFFDLPQEGLTNLNRVITFKAGEWNSGCSWTRSFTLRFPFTTSSLLCPPSPGCAQSSRAALPGTRW